MRTWHLKEFWIWREKKKADYLNGTRDDKEEEEEDD